MMRGRGVYRVVHAARVCPDKMRRTSRMLGNCISVEKSVKSRSRSSCVCLLPCQDIRQRSLCFSHVHLLVAPRKSLAAAELAGA
jgi:hypothetical protein